MSFLIIPFPSYDDNYCGYEKNIFLCTTCSPFLLTKTRLWITNFLKNFPVCPRTSAFTYKTTWGHNPEEGHQNLFLI
jgi:hypothetical protein